MRLASFLPSLELDRPAARRRATSILLTILAHLLLLLLLIRLAPPQFGSSKSGSRLTTFSVAPEAQEESAPAKSAAKQPARTQPTVPPPTAPPPPPIKLPTTAAPWVLTPGLEKFDVRQLPSAPPSQQLSDASATDSGGNSGSGDSRSDKPVGVGSAGQPLYDAAWYREPTDAELAFYLKNTRPGSGYGMVACQTIARFHVDNCEELGETPGSGYARAVREAAWQFLVLPPRVGGRVMVGSWVRIRIDYTQRKASDR
ncbi:hypothetical protein ACSBM8_00405 [Sphingomonas sp. ASY06-1R]|jgi:protein TonB|uniref:hypothetical protein n=1 Tax=Sphingomonas sp. ASY06-1R TaxID=3445771 RepID=UPI003FA284B6